MRLRLLHLADVRLGAAHAYAGDAAERRRRDTQESFKAAAEYALDPRRVIDMVVLAGGPFDVPRPDAESFALIRGVFARLAAGGVTVVVLPGFHDALGADSVWWRETFAGAQVLAADAPGAPPVLDVRGVPVRIYSAAFRRGRMAVPFAGFRRTEDPGFHVGVPHGTVEGSPEAAERTAAWTLPLEALDASAVD